MKPWFIYRFFQALIMLGSFARACKLLYEYMTMCVGLGTGVPFRLNALGMMREAEKTCRHQMMWRLWVIDLTCKCFHVSKLLEQSISNMKSSCLFLALQSWEVSFTCELWWHGPIKGRKKKVWFQKRKPLKQELIFSLKIPSAFGNFLCDMCTSRGPGRLELCWFQLYRFWIRLMAYVSIG